MATVVVLGDRDDPHIAAVVEVLTGLGHSVAIFDIWTTWSPATLDIGHASTHLSLNGNATDVTGIWLRLKPRLSTGLSEAVAFTLRERREFLLGLCHTLGAVSIINDPVQQELARSKPLQLHLALRFGFRIPQTWISNDGVALSVKAKACGGRAVYKPLSWLATSDGRVLFTNSVSTEELHGHAEAIRLAPGIYQEVVAKACEYRITIMDDDYFGVRIYSQERKDTELDWRRNQRHVRYELWDVPCLLREKLGAFMSELGLRYGAVDLIETPEGELVFLEVNPSGNWLWLEEQLHLPIAAAIASALCKSPCGFPS